jgi:tetratricopeptide (TPR) repeat protein
MPKGAVEDTRVITASAHLREMLHEIEVGLADLRGRREGVLDLLRRRDEIEAELARLLDRGVDLRAERSRLETVDNVMRRRARAILRELLGTGGLPAARREQDPPSEHWWWYLDRYVAGSVQQRAIRIGAVLVGALLLLVLVNTVMHRFFGVSPEEREAHALVSQAEQHLLHGEYDEALSFYQSAVEAVPDLVEPRIRMGVLYEVQGRFAEAQESLRLAREIAEDDAAYYVLLARAYEMVGLLEPALAAADQAVALSPDSAEAYLTRGSIHEGADHYEEAIDDFERAATLADAQGQNGLYVLARTRLGMLMQRGPSPFETAPEGESRAPNLSYRRRAMRS